MNRCSHRFWPFGFLAALLLISLLTAASAPAGLSAARQANDTFVSVSPFEPATTLDPALAYDSSSLEVIQQIYEPLLWFDKETSAYIPHLAGRWDISSNQDSYTFYPRRNITFQNGGSLQPHDIAYSIQRGLLQSEGSSVLLIDGIYGYWNITEEMDGGPYWDRESLLANADPTELLAVCEDVKQRVTADDAAGMVTIDLEDSSGTFLTVLATYGYVLDMEWTIDQGDWDGDCDTWQDYFRPGSTEEGSKLDRKANGSGPFMLQSWNEGSDMTLTRYAGYWKGPAPLNQVVYKVADDAGQREQMLLDGQADYAYLENANLQQYVIVDNSAGDISLNNPAGVLKAFRGQPRPSSSDIFFTFDINTEDNPYIGGGVSSDFFMDINVRKAFSHAFDYASYNAAVYDGQGIRRTGPIAANLMGYSPSQPTYDYDPNMAKQELAQALGGAGFSMTLVYNTGNSGRQAAMELLEKGIEALDPKYQINVISMSNSDMLIAWSDGKLPLAPGGWFQDYGHPDNWLQPYLFGTYALRSRMPQDLQNSYQADAQACLKLSGSAQRSCYEAIQEDTHDRALQLYLLQPTTSKYVRAEVMGYESSMAYHEYPYFYAISKGAATEVTAWSPGNTAEIQLNTAGTAVTVNVPQAAFGVPVDIVTEADGNVAGKTTAGYEISSTAFSLFPFDESGNPLPDASWTAPMMVTVGGVGVQQVGAAGDQVLLRWNGRSWEDGACDETSARNDLPNIPICKSGLYAVGEEQLIGFMPVVRAN